MKSTGLVSGMQNAAEISVPRPKRWDEPMDPLMSDSDVAWLRSRQPFVSLEPGSFPRSMPLDGILKNDCRLHRCPPGQLIVREGDYGNSAFLVLSGSVRVFVESLQQDQLGREEAKVATWTEALWQFFRPDEFPETRSIRDVSPSATSDSESRVQDVDGRQAIFLQDCDAVLRDHESVSLGPGELFGEVAAMYRSPRTATVVADTEASLLEIRWQGLNILRRDAKFADKLEQHYRSQWLTIHLREIPLLRYVPDDHLERIAAVTQLRSFGRLAWNTDYKKTRELSPREQIQAEPLVADEGSMPTELLIVRAGFGRLCRRHGDGHMTTAYLGKGQVFGLNEVTYNAARPTSSPPRMLANQLRAVGFLDTLHIPVETFAEDILPFLRRDELPSELAELLLSSSERSSQKIRDAGLDRRSTQREKRKRERTGTSQKLNLPVVEATSEGKFESTSLLEFMVQGRFNNGQQAMVIDLHRCTRCDDCVKACAATHGGNPRFVRDGARHDRLQVVQACMQCTDPVCMIGCPTGAIVRDEQTGVVAVHEPICVGCGTCSNACPYDNIRMMEVVDAKGRPFTDQKSGKPITKATKCDMCQGMPSGPACVSACPHDALVRIDLSESAPLSDWLQQRQ